MNRFICIPALLFLGASLAMQAQSAKQYFRAGDEFFKKLSYENAIEQYTKVIELDPDYDKAYIQRALSYTKIKDFEKAAADFDRAIVFNDKDAELYYFSGKAYHLLGKNEMAYEKLSAAIEMKRKFLEAYQERSLVLMDLGRYEEALDDCRTCLDISEDDQGYYNLSLIHI